MITGFHAWRRYCLGAVDMILTPCPYDPTRYCLGAVDMIPTFRESRRWNLDLNLDLNHAPPPMGFIKPQVEP